MMVIFLVGLVSMILMRTLRKDYARYSKEDDLDEMVIYLAHSIRLFYWKLILYFNLSRFDSVDICVVHIGERLNLLLFKNGHSVNIFNSMGCPAKVIDNGWFILTKEHEKSVGIVNQANEWT